MAKKTYQEQIRYSYPNHPIIKPIAPCMVKTWGEGMQVIPSPLEIREVKNSIGVIFYCDTNLILSR